MNKTIAIIGLVAGIALAAFAQAQPAYTIPTYKTLSATGTTTATVYFAESPYQQVRVVSAFATSDQSTADLKFYTGTTPMTVAYTNAAGTQVGVAATNGFAVGDQVMIETKAESSPTDRSPHSGRQRILCSGNRLRDEARGPNL